MKKNCSKCGYEFREGDVFCAKCGQKLFNDNNTNDISLIEKLPQSAFVQDILARINRESNTKKQLNKDSEEKIDNSYLTIILVFILISALMFLGTNYTLSKQTSEKNKLEYETKIKNPHLIPELKQSSNYKDLIKNLKEIQTFLVLYLKYSNDSYEIKEQIFTSYLKEINKISYLPADDVMFSDIKECEKLSKNKLTHSCLLKINNELKKVGINAVADKNLIYLYPDNEFIKLQYYRFVTSEMKKYLDLKAKYNIPVTVGLNLNIEPKTLINKIVDYENLLSKTTNPYIVDNLEETLYEDVYKLLFNPSIYATTTKEMTPKFKNAYQSFARTKKSSQFYPMILSYLDKKRTYSENNFKNDYPYKTFERDFESNIKNSAFEDIFAQLRKKVFESGEENQFAYVYNMVNGEFKEYNIENKINQDELTISKINEHNNITIYNNVLAVKQELNIPKYGELFIQAKGLYVYNKDRLTISKVQYNGRQFNLVQLASSDVESLFPGIEVINLDSYPSYNIMIEKPNMIGNFIILAKYSKGYAEYMLSSKKSDMDILKLPNMFSISSTQKTTISFHDSNKDPDSTSEGKPTYKIIVQTSGYNYQEPDYSEIPQYDEETAKQNSSENETSPNMMPKVDVEKYELEDEDLEDKAMNTAPNQNIEPPKEEYLDDN